MKATFCSNWSLKTNDCSRTPRLGTVIIYRTHTHGANECDEFSSPTMASLAQAAYLGHELIGLRQLLEIALVLAEGLNLHTQSWYAHH